MLRNITQVDVERNTKKLPTTIIGLRGSLRTKTCEVKLRFPLREQFFDC